MYVARALAVVLKIWSIHVILFTGLGQSVKLLMVFASTVIPGIGLVEIHHKDFYFLLHMYVFRNRASSSNREGLVYVGATFVAPQIPHEYIHSDMGFRSQWTLCTFCHCTILSNIMYRGFLSLQACADYAKTYLITLKLQLVSWMVIGLTTSKFKPLILLMHGFCLSNTTDIWIHIV
jgi:hypothetical protein